MQKCHVAVFALASFVLVLANGVTAKAEAQTEKSPYPAMAPLDQYLIADKNAEVALARSAAPPSIADKADVMALGRDGYTTAVKGSNGFVCIVERAWASPSDQPGFWNPKMRAPHCFNAAAARSFLPIFLMRTKLALAGKSKAEIIQATTAALDKKQLPALEPGAMVYMMSKQQYLNDTDKAWHPHLMFLAPGNVEKSWGANLPDSPVIAANDPEERVTIFMLWTGKWSDGTPAPAAMHMQ
jgi:hypothetical protein